MVKIAIPQLGDAVAPRFEAASHILLATAEGGQVHSTTTIDCGGREGYQRVRMLQIHRVTVLICNGINGSYRDMLTGSGVTVVPNVSGLVDYALGRYLEGKLVPDDSTEDNGVGGWAIPHQKLVESARGLFESRGYQVGPGPGPDAFLIDLVAEITCPVCNRPVKVAICCGAHTYRADQEIVEFHHATPSGYNARVYVCPPSPPIKKCCREYGIELVAPEASDEEDDRETSGKIPLLKGPVIDHEQASGSAKR